MTTTHSYHGLAWIDMESPDEHEIATLVRRYGLHPLVGEELKSSSTLAKIDFYKDYILAVITIPVRIRQNGSTEVVDREVDFVIGKNFLITSRYDTIEQLEYFAKIFDTNTVLDKGEKIEHGGSLFYYMVKRIYAGMFQDLENIRDGLLAAETRIFKGDEHSMVQSLSNLSRELIDFKQTARIHREIWDEMIENNPHELFSKDFILYIRDIRDEFNRVHELIGNCRELLADLRETNDSLLSTKQNDIIKILTLVAFIFYPLTFITAIFTIPSPFTPLVNSPQGWNMIMIGMAVIAAGMWWFFKKKRWI